MQHEFAGLAEVPKRCRRCGAAFAMTARRRPGRAVAFCSERCRRAAAREQRVAWQRQNGRQLAGAMIACLHCGQAFTPQRHSAGRVSRLCSVECRRGRKAELKRRRNRDNLSKETTS